MITVWPVIYFDFQRSGVPVSGDIDDLGEVPVVVNDMTVEWGRSGYFDAVDPARLKMRLWDSTGEWARRIRDNQALGTHVQVMWEAEDDDTGKRNRGTLYRGLVTGVQATRMQRTDDSHEHYWRIDLTAHDPLSSLGNIYPLPGVLPTQRLFQRIAWLKGLMDYGGIPVNGIVYQGAYERASLPALEVGKESAKELMDMAFEAMSHDAYTYSPEYNSVMQCERHDGDFRTFLASFSDEIGGVLISSEDSKVNNITRPGIAISACSVTVDGDIQITATPDTDINRVESTYRYVDTSDWEVKDQVQASEQITVGHPRRLMSNDCWFQAEPVAGDPTRDLIDLQHRSLWDRCRGEGRRPRHPDMRFHAGHKFATERIMQWWIQTWENARPGFINGDEAHRWLMSGDRDWSPIVSPLGGTVTYNGGSGWDMDLTVQWSHNRVSVTPMVWKNLQQFRWSAADDSYPWWWDLLGLPKPPAKPVGTATPDRDIRWGAPDHESTQYRFDTSVTWSDLKYLDNSSKAIKDLLQ